MFDASKKRKVKTKEKKPKNTDAEKYNIEKRGNLLIYMPKEDAMQVLEDLQIVSLSGRQRAAVRTQQSFTWQKYRSAPMDEVDQLWNYEQKADDGKKVKLTDYTYDMMLENIFRDQFSQ